MRALVTPRGRATTRRSPGRHRRSVTLARHGTVRRRSEAGPANVRCSTACSRTSAAVRAPSWSIRGEAGVGKTALLDYAAGRPPASGSPRSPASSPRWSSPFAGLHQLCAPLLDRLDALPGPSGRAAASRSAWRRATPPDRFLVGAGRAEPARRGRPRSGRCSASSTTRSGSTGASAQVLGFVARRLLAESVALVFAVREPATSDELAGPARAARRRASATTTRARCCDRSSPGRLDERVRDRIVAETRGNPLALLELPRGLTRGASSRAASGCPTRCRCRAGSRRASVRRLDALPAETQRLLLLGGGRAGRRPDCCSGARPSGSGSPATRPAPAEDGRAARRSARRSRFRHPLVRSAVYRSASRRRSAGAVHRALAEATDAERRSRPPRLAPRRRRRRARRGRRRRARALGRPGAGPRRARRGGRVPAARGRADAPTRRGARSARWPRRRPSCRPARSTRRSGCWPTAEAGPLDELAARPRRPAARADRVRLERRQRRAAAAAARRRRRLEPLDVELARETYLDAWGAALFAGRLADAPATCCEVSRAARAAPPPPRPAASVRPAARRPRAAGHRRTRRGGADAAAGGRARSPPTSVPAEERLPLGLADDGAAATCSGTTRPGTRSTRARSQLARDAGALARLPIDADRARPCSSRWRGDFAAAASLIAEADAVTEATGTRIAPYGAMLLAALPGPRGRGRRADRGDDRERDRRRPGHRRPVRAVGGRDPVQRPRPLRGGAAPRPSRRATTRPSCSSPTWALPELIEAGVRSGQTEVARRARSSGWRRPRPPRGTDWALGHRGALAGAAERGRGRRGALPRGDRPARPHPAAPGARPRAPALRRVAAPRGPPRRRARAAAHRPRACSPRSAWRRSPSAPAASCSPRARRCASARAETRDDAHRRRRSRSPGSPATACPTRRSARSCSSARARSSGTCARCSPSSASARAPASTTPGRPDRNAALA